jgi:hypothetical protein
VGNDTLRSGHHVGLAPTTRYREVVQAGFELSRFIARSPAHRSPKRSVDVAGGSSPKRAFNRELAVLDVGINGINGTPFGQRGDECRADRVRPWRLAHLLVAAGPLMRIRSERSTAAPRGRIAVQLHRNSSRRLKGGFADLSVNAHQHLLARGLEVRQPCPGRRRRRRGGAAAAAFVNPEGSSVRL